MAEDQGKKDKEKLEFSPEGEFLGYMSLDQAQMLARQAAREAPGAYGSAFDGVHMAYNVAELEETEDRYVITLSFRPQGEFSGRRHDIQSGRHWLPSILFNRQCCCRRIHRNG